VGAAPDAAPRVVRVVPEVAGIDKEFDYSVPVDLDGLIAVGTSVRVLLHGRRVAAWVVADRVVPPPGVRLLGVRAVRGLGPAPEVVELARWAAWRWAGRLASVLRASSPPRLVGSLPRTAGATARTTPVGPSGRVGSTGGAESSTGGTEPPTWGEAFNGPPTVVRLGPAADRWPLVEEAASLASGGASILVLCPNVTDAGVVADRLRRRRVPVALMPEQWPEAAAGGRVVVGARGAAWAPVPELAAVLVLDGHDDAYKEERNPCWSAWEVAARRAERAGAPCVIASPCPTVELLAWGRLLHPPRPVERSQWPVVEVVDRRGDDPRSGLVSERLVGLLRAGAGEPGRPLVCVLNRRGRARLLACRACGAVVRCHVCDSAMVQRRGSDQLSCSHCDAQRPLLCADCGATRLSVLRPGVTRLVEELGALAGVAVAEVSSDVTAEAEWATAPIVVGTEAVLHRVRRAGAVAFLEIDQELTAPRYRAAEQALALIARAGRLVGARGRVVVQTRLPEHDVLRAAAGADPGLLAVAEAERRRLLRLPPHSALALVSTSAVEAVRPVLVSAGLAVADFGPGSLLVRAPDSATLADALGAATAGLDPAVRATLRVEVDPSRV